MLGSQNSRRQNPPLAWQLRIDDLQAQLAPLDRYGFPGFGSAVTSGICRLADGWRNALRGIVCCAGDSGPDCEAA